MHFSSCSGRIALFSSASQRKGGQWLLVEHARVSTSQVISAIENLVSLHWGIYLPLDLLTNAHGHECNQGKDTPSVVFLKHEPFILHLLCRSISVRNKLCTCKLHESMKPITKTLSVVRINQRCDVFPCRRHARYSKSRCAVASENQGWCSANARSSWESVHPAQGFFK